MANRRLIRLSQLKHKLATENLEETDWVTFGVIVKKVTPQSTNNVSNFAVFPLDPKCWFSILRSLFNLISHLLVVNEEELLC